ncbi:MAG: dephospho-CoA kinase [Caldilineaceae bacterium]|nr:dephospho-CoA kinase [Caldilineaceae bacterium]
MNRSSAGPLYSIGLTGNIATGKSTILAYLAEKGACVLDADKAAHAAMAPDGPAHDKVIAEFGSEILTDANEIDRVRLGDIVFHDAEALKRLEEIVHPATFELLRWKILDSPADVVILEAIKLLESGRLVNLSDEVWVVTSRPQVQLRRLMERRGMSEEDARARMAAQPSEAGKVAMADVVIENNGDLPMLYARLDKLWSDILVKVEERRAMRDERA